MAKDNVSAAVSFQSTAKASEEDVRNSPRVAERRSFLKGLGVAGAALSAGALLSTEVRAEGSSGILTKGDAAILRFLAAAEAIESDLWLQYAELGGIQDAEIANLVVSTKFIPDYPGLKGGDSLYTSALNNLDSDMAQYIHDNTEDELTHLDFINAYLRSKGAKPVHLDSFRTLPSSKASAANQIGRITNLLQLTVDTSWWGRYRSRDNNPDLGLPAGFSFAQAVPSLSQGKFPAIPRSDADHAPADHVQAIANTAAFHFGFIEQGGSSLYPSLAQRVTSPEVLRILLSIGPTETSHFQTWHDKAGNALQDPLDVTDSTTSNPTLVFPNINVNPGGEDVQTNLIMPEPCPFLNRKFPVCSVIRPTETRGVAMGAVKGLVADGLFIGQSKEFLQFITELAEEADAARRGD